MGQLKTSMIIDLAGNLQGQAQKYLSSMQRFGTGSSRSMLAFHKTVELTGGALTLQIREVGDLSARFTQLAINAGATLPEIDKIKEKIFEVSQLPKIRLNPEELTSAFEEIVSKSGDLKFAQENIENIAAAIKATGGSGNDIGQMMLQFRLQGIKSQEEVLKLIDLISVLGKRGSFILKDMAGQMPRMVGAIGGVGRTGPAAMKDLVVLAQYLRPNMESPEATSTVIENFIREIADPVKGKILKRNGIKVWADKDHTKMRPLVDLYKEIYQASGGKRENLSQVFERESIRAFGPAGMEKQLYGKMKTLDEYLKVEADGSQIIKDATLNAKEFNSVMGDTRTSFKRLADEHLIRPVRATANYLDKFGPGTTKNVMTDVGIGVGVVGAAVVARKAFTVYRDLFGTGARGGLGGALGGLGGKVGPIPVYVVNKHLSMLPGQGWGFPGKEGGMPIPGGSPSKLGKLAKLGRVAGRAFAVGGAAEVGYSIGTYVNENLVDGTSFGNAIGYAINKAFAALGNKESKLAIEINSKDGSTAKVTRMESKGMDLEIDSGLMSVHTP